MHPFDIRSVFLARHAQHVVLIHFPIALFIAGVAFDYAAHWKKSETIATAAYLNLLLAGASTLPVVLSGLLAWQWALEGQSLKGVLLMHLVLGCAMSVLICFVLWLHRRGRMSGRALPAYRLPVEAIAVLLLVLTAHLGGILSGVNVTG